LEDLGVDGSIILERILKVQGRRMFLDSSASGYELVMNSCEYGNELPVFIKGEESD
jgi:hypothetical protein